MDVVVTSFGSDGDFNPVLAIATALVRRGATVTFVANPFYERRVTITGCHSVPAGDFLDVFGVLEANPQYFTSRGGLMAIWRDLTAPSIRETFPMVRDTARAVGATIVVSHLASFGGAWAASAASVRSVTVTTGPSVWLSRHHPTTNWRAPRFLQSLLRLAMRGVSSASFGPKLRRLAAAIEAPVIDTIHAAELNLGVWPVEAWTSTRER